MAIINRIGDLQDEMTAWRRDLHAHQVAEERRTSPSSRQTARLRPRWCIRHIAKTGVVGVLKAGAGAEAIALRADMDALPIGRRPGFLRLDGTRQDARAAATATTMLLGAARYLAETRNFDGTVYFIFQPAEEMDGGGRVMVEEGLFERFPTPRGVRSQLADGAVRHFRSAPRADHGRRRPGADPATGQGGHGAMPHRCRDPMAAGAQIVMALQTVVARNLDPSPRA